MGDKIIIDIDLPDDNIYENGSVQLNEKTIENTKNYKILLKANEMTHHHRPHVHAIYDNKNEYSISIDDKIEVIAGQDDKYAKRIIKGFVLHDIQRYRKEWNSFVQSNYKFISNEKDELVPPSSK